VSAPSSAPPLLPAATAGECLVRACRLEIEALKPGNVGLHASGHGMTAADFLASAEAIRMPLCVPGARVGGRVLAAIRATRDAVGCNTNLGIVLSCAPLAHAAQSGARPLRGALRLTLDGLDRHDACDTYRAIRLARPGGLGRADRHDVADEPDVTLLQAMHAAAGRDTIAKQYAEGYADVFDLALPELRAARRRWSSDAWAATACYLGWLSRLPDTLVARKRGVADALRVQSEAIEWRARLDAADDPRALADALLGWDTDLKARSINPGTSADLTVATAFADALDAVLYPPPAESRAGEIEQKCRHACR
jgi:triphosphoribosyl-dephospho-CoA synthase